jgi:hypothetical protein
VAAVFAGEQTYGEVDTYINASMPAANWLHERVGNSDDGTISVQLS